MTSAISVLTIAGGRPAHLANLIRGLTRQSRPPAELVVAVIGEDLHDDLPATDFPIRQVPVAREGDLPLAAARNAVAGAATGDLLVFLDVDCIPAPEALADYAGWAAREPGVLMGEVGYMPAGATANGIDYDRFERLAERHPDRQGPPPEGKMRPCNDYRCFWSLNFAIPRETFHGMGGFDPRFTGYGGEDTDFARTLDAAEVPIWWMRGGRVYHQHHPHHMPPVHHLTSVVRNAELFASKWGHRTMEHWLHAFRLMGLIEKDEERIRILRAPGPEELEISRQHAHMPYAHTRRVLDLIEARRGEIATGRARTAEVEAAQADLGAPLDPAR